jgi:arylsulfatase A-like enzyme
MQAKYEPMQMTIGRAPTLPPLSLYFILILAWFRPAAGASLQAPPPKPNILLIVSDDQGYADAGFQGSKEIPTPNLDRLAKSGMHCTSGYVTHPFCSPTRAALLTGRYQQRFGHVYNPFYDPADAREGLPLGEKLLPEHLRGAGYATGWMGKWHLGASPEHAPEHRGFEEGFGFIGGGHHYFNWKPGKGEYNLPILRNGQEVEVPEHYTTRLGVEAANFEKRHADHPWFLYLAFNAPHMPHQPTPERIARFSHIQNRQRARYAAQISLMDDAIGEVLAALDASHQRERTLIFFFTDNGGPVNVGAVNTPLRGSKGDVFEGGIRVPYLVSWPGRIPAGSTYVQPVSSVDVFATALAVAGARMPTDKVYDSVNLLPHLNGENMSAPHERLFWRTGTGQLAAVRQGDWKLVRQENKPDELYNLATDISETKNLAGANPEKIHQLSLALDTWQKPLPPPAFIGTSRNEKPATTTATRPPTTPAR